MAVPYTLSCRPNLTVCGDRVDVHARWRRTPDGTLDVAWCGVYVYPVSSAGPDRAAVRPLVAGYWYEPTALDAATLLTAAGVLA